MVSTHTDNTSKFPPAIIGIKPSKMLSGEVGLFALRDLRATTIIWKAFSCGEKFFDQSVYDELDKLTKQVVTAHCSMVYDGFYAVPDVNYLPIQSFCNYSCEPNLGFDEDGNTVLIKDVREGDELTIDASFFCTHPDWKLDCRCGSKNCRGIVTGNDWKDPEFVRKNKQWMNV